MRLFVALVPPEGLRRDLERRGEELRGLCRRGRVVPWENIHLTLAFLGETDRRDAVERAMGRGAGAPFSLHTARPGLHPGHEPRRTLLPTELTMEESEELARLWFRKLEGLCRFRPALALDRCRQLGVLTTCLARGYVARHPEGPLTEDDAALIGMAAPFCDIGMLGLPDPEDHREEGDPRHTILGHELLAVEGDLPLLRYGAEIALWHHRNADGSGWPQDMDGEAPLSAMLVHTALRLQHYLHYYQGYEDALDRAVRTMKGEVGSILTEEMAGLLEETRQLRAALL